MGPTLNGLRRSQRNSLEFWLATVGYLLLCGDLRVTCRIIEFTDKAIHKLRIKKGSRKDFKFKDINVSYLTGLVLRYLPLI